MTSQAIPAATLILARDGRGAPEHLFVERSPTMAFAAGAVVFPGGRVDPGDRALANRFPHLDVDDAAARIAAIRETIEEAGVAVGLSIEDIDEWRAALLDGAPFEALIDTAGASLDLDLLVPFARWCPNSREMRTFDTRFYMARLPEDAALASVDATENTHLFWSAAADVLARADEGTLKIIFPTRRNLERLALHPDYDALVDHAAHYPVETITPWIEDRDGVPHLCIPTHLGYPVCAEAMNTAARS